jgi:hypothetical protein
MRRWFVIPFLALAWAAFLYQTVTGDYSNAVGMLTLGAAFTYGWVFWLPSFVNRLRNRR